MPAQPTPTPLSIQGAVGLTHWLREPQPPVMDTEVLEVFRLHPSREDRSVGTQRSGVKVNEFRGTTSIQLMVEEIKAG